MSHPHNDLRDHKVSERRAHSLYGMPHRASGGAVEHSDERADKALVKSMVKGTSLKAAGGKVKARADRPCRAKGGRVKKGKGTNVNVIIAPQGGGMPPGPPMGMKPPMPAGPPMPPPGGPPPGAPPMMPHKAGGRAYKSGGRVKRAWGGAMPGAVSGPGAFGGGYGMRSGMGHPMGGPMGGALGNAGGLGNPAGPAMPSWGMPAGGRGAVSGPAPGGIVPPPTAPIAKPSFGDASPMTGGPDAGNPAMPPSDAGMMLNSGAPAGGIAMPGTGGPAAGTSMLGSAMYAKGGRVKSGNTWAEGVRDGTHVQNNPSGKTANQKDQPGQLNRGKVITYRTGGAVEHPKRGGMAPHLPSGSGGGEARMFKERRAAKNYARPGKTVNGGANG